MTEQSAPQTPPCRIYSLYAVEQAAYEIMHYWFQKMEQRLLEEPGNVMTEQNAVCGHAHWILDGRMVASPDAGNPDDPLPRHAADDHFPEDCIEGLGWRELMNLADDARAWVNNPTFIRLPDDHYMGSPFTPEKAEETRRVKAVAQPHRQYGISDMIDVVFKDNEIIRIGDKECSIDLSVPEVAMLAGAGYVKHITMRVPQLDIVGPPSCFESLDDVSLLHHLCYGTGFSPLLFASWKATYDVVQDDNECALEYTFSLRPWFVEALRKG